MEKLYPDYQGYQPPREEFLKAPELVQKFVSTVVGKLNEMGSKFKSLAAKLKVANKLITAKDELLKKKDALIASLKRENKDLVALVRSLNTQIKRKDEKIHSLTNGSKANSTNSNLPPSKDPIGFDRKKATKQSGKKAEGSSKDKEEKKKAHHPGAERPILKPTREEKCLPPGVCPHCGCQHWVNLTESSVHQHIELVKNPLEVIHFHVYAGTCPECGKVTSGTVPVEFRDFFGPRLTAFVAVVDSMTGTTRRQIQKLLEDVFGCPISQGGIQNILYRASDAILPHYEAIAYGVRKALYNHADETCILNTRSGSKKATTLAVGFRKCVSSLFYD